MNREEVKETIWNQLPMKTLGLDNLGFKVLGILWKFREKRLTGLTREVIHQKYHPESIKTVKEVVKRKPGKTRQLKTKNLQSDFT